MTVNGFDLRLILTFVVVFVVLVGCFFLLLFPSQASGETLIPFITGIVGITLGWVFNKESSSSGQQAAERSVTLGAKVQKNGGNDTEIV